MIEISKTDMAKIIKFLDDATRYYYRNGKSNREFNRARMIELLVKKLKKKLCQDFSKSQILS